MAIGWHFLYEGMEKLESTRNAATKPFSAEAYLRYATGPLAPYFRGLVPDVNGLAKLDPERLKAGWADEVKKIEDHFKFDEKQHAAAQGILTKSEAEADLWFQDKEFLENRAKYYHELGEVQKVERNLRALSSERERASDRRRDLEAERKKLLKDLDAIGSSLRDGVVKLASEEQQKAGPYPGQRWTTLKIPRGTSPLDTRIPVPEWNSLEWVDHLTIYGLLAIGVGLLLGFLTRPAALAGAVFLGQIYLSMPPWWRGMPASPMAEGHYWIVNKNLIEMFACLFIACTPSGRWIGVDALLFGWIGRRRDRDDEDWNNEPDRRRGQRNRAAS